MVGLVRPRPPAGSHPGAEPTPHLPAGHSGLCAGSVHNPSAGEGPSRGGWRIRRRGPPSPHGRGLSSWVLARSRGQGGYDLRLLTLDTQLSTLDFSTPRLAKRKAPGRTLTARPGARDTDWVWLFSLLHRGAAPHSALATNPPSLARGSHKWARA